MNVSDQNKMLIRSALLNGYVATRGQPLKEVIEGQVEEIFKTLETADMEIKSKDD